jgi:hypothetical protein
MVETALLLMKGLRKSVFPILVIKREIVARSVLKASFIRFGSRG